MRGKSTVPKDALINLILNNLSEEVIRDRINLCQNVNVLSRINNSNKNDLVDLLNSTEEGEKLLKKLEDKYPLPGSPTLYLVISRNLPPSEKIVERTADAANNNDCALTLSASKTIRRVYNTERARILNFGPDFIEIPIFYEHRIDYTSADQDDWGENKTIYDLRRAFVWISHAYDHGLIACSDYSGLKPIITWVTTFLQFRLDLPNIPVDLFNRLADGGTPRTATFAVSELALQPYLDIQSLTIYDQELESSETFGKLKSDNEREQTAGYFSRHPTLPAGGLGIARRYGRIWTPSHLPKDQLLISATGLISRTEVALIEKLETDDKSFISHYDNIPVQINGKTLTRKPRDVFNEIAWALFRLKKRHINQVEFDNDWVVRAIDHKEKLGFTTTVETECDHCGPVLVKCPICSTPYEAVVTNGKIKIVCPNHKDIDQNENDEFKCECGQEIEVMLPNSIKIYPGLSATLAFRDFISQKDLKFDGWFLFDGNLLCSYTKSKIRSKEYQLSELNKWRVRAHIHVLGPISEKRTRMINEILRNIREKCNKNSWHPDRKMCIDCQNQKVLFKDINKTNMCLPKLMGLAIDENFDGIHSGAEKADIKYQDKLFFEDNREIFVGIHLKSRENHPPYRGVGQASTGIKGLYAQLFFTIRKEDKNKRNFDMLGVSIPNKVFKETKDAMIGLTNELGFPILFLDEDDWVSITAASIDKIENS